MKEKAAVAIAALMLASLAAGLSVSTTVSADHTPSVSVDKTVVKKEYSGVFTFTVVNAPGSDAIKEVQLTLDKDKKWSGGAPLKKLPKDNVVWLVDDNKVILPAGTIVEVELDDAAKLIIFENTDVIIPEDENIYCPAIAGPIRTLLENVVMEPMGDYSTEGVENLLSQGYWADKLENLKVSQPLIVSLWQDNRLRLLQDTLAILESGNIVRLPENLLVQVVKGQADEKTKENFAATAEIKVMVDKSTFRCVSSSLSTSPSLYGVNMAGEIVELVEKIVVIRPDTVVGIQGKLKVKIAENTQVIRVANSNSRIEIDASAAENVPANWMQDPANRKWIAIGDNTLKAGENLSFPVSLRAPSEAGTYTFYVTTVDVKGIIKDTPVQITVDNAPPSLTISVSPSWVKGSTQVTITVKGDEPFTFDNVFVAENNGEKVAITMTPNADNTEWTGTYTTGENENRDGFATIYVVRARDAVGNENTVSDDTKLFVDRKKPGKPDLDAMRFPENWDSRSRFAINCILTAGHDNLMLTPPDFSPEGMKLVILVDNTPIELTAGPTGRISYSLTLSDGRHTVGAYIVDKAGNKGEENLKNVVIDNNKPTITFVFPENGAYIKENKPTFKVTIADTVGVENSRHITGTDDNYGYRVCLCYENGTPYPGGENLVPKANPTEIDNIWGNIVFTTFTFENAWPTELPENTYILCVLAGDNFRFENVWIKFTVDIRAPNPPNREKLESNIKPGDLISPTGTKTKTLTLRGSANSAEANATIKVYVTTDGGVTWTEVPAARTTAGADGSWLTTLDLSAYVGKTLGIAVTATDAAGNESDRTLWGYVIYDVSAPKVSITSPTTGTKTSKASIEVTGTVTKDPWEDWSDITLRIQVGTGSVQIPLAGVGDTVTFSYSVALSEGTNTILVWVSDGMNSSSASVTVTRTVTPWGTYAVVLVIIALILAAIAILRVRK